MEKKFQIFIGSTYTDLIATRLEVLHTILKLGGIPIGMEDFTANAMPPFDVIKRYLDSTDYYILILGGRYGSLYKDENKSYIHKEIDYVKSKNIPFGVIAVKDLSTIPTGQSEDSEEGRQRLRDFTQELRQHTIAHWKEHSEIPNLVATTLNTLKADFPREGWLKHVLPDNFEETVEIRKTLLNLIEQSEYYDSNKKYFEIIVFKWRILAEIEKINKLREDNFTIQSLPVYPYLRLIFGGIITLLNKGDTYQAISTLDFLMKDINDETEFLPLNIDAINRGVNIQRVILLEEDLFKNPQANVRKGRMLKDLIFELNRLKGLYGDKFNGLELKFFITEDIEESFPSAPFATIFRNNEGTTNTLDYEHALQVVPYLNENYEDNRHPKIKLYFLSEKTRYNIIKRHQKFVQLIEGQELLTVEEIYDKYKLIKDALEVHPSSIFKRGSLVQFSQNSTYCIFRSNNYIPNCFACVKEETNKEIYTIVDLEVNFNKHVEDGFVLKIDGKLCAEHSWKFFKISIVNALNMTGAIEYISKKFSDLDISICLISLFSSELIFVKESDFIKAQGIFTKFRGVELQDINLQGD